LAPDMWRTCPSAFLPSHVSAHMLCRPVPATTISRVRSC
jgi:hypothetical protein